jgi:hypothetical protein
MKIVLPIMASLTLMGCVQPPQQVHVTEIRYQASPTTGTRFIMAPEKTPICREVTHLDSDGRKMEERIRADLTRIGAEPRQIEAEVRKFRRQICD